MEGFSIEADACSFRQVLGHISVMELILGRGRFVAGEEVSRLQWGTLESNASDMFGFF